MTVAWLADFQARFGAAVRTPLDRASGTLTATPSAYDAALVADTRDGLDVYNRQYWFRLFDVMQRAYPLTARLVGLWEFNAHAARFLEAQPPRSWDLDEAPDGFADFFEPSDDRLLDAVRIDAAYRTVARAPVARPATLDGADAATQLVPSPSVAFFEERAPLTELRQRMPERMALPDRLPTARAWALVRREGGSVLVALAPREAELLALLRARPIGEALAALEGSAPEEERARLPANVQTWLARSVERGFWLSRRRHS